MLWAIARKVERVNGDQYREFQPPTAFDLNYAIYNPNPPTSDGWDPKTCINTLALRTLRAAIPEWNGDIHAWTDLPMNIIIKACVAHRVDDKKRIWVNVRYIAPRSELESGEERGWDETDIDARARIRLAGEERAAQALREYQGLPDPEKDAKTWNLELWKAFKGAAQVAGVPRDKGAVEAVWNEFCIGLGITMGSPAEDWQAAIAATLASVSDNPDHPVRRAFKLVKIRPTPETITPPRASPATLAAQEAAAIADDLF